MEVAGMAGKALAGLGNAIADIGEKGMSLATQFQAKKTALKDTTDILEANNKIEERLAAFKETAATKTDPQDIVKFTNEWKTTLPKDFQMESYSPEVKARVQIALDHAANVGTIEGYGGLDAQGNPMGGYAFKAQSKKMDIPLVQMQQNALDGKWAMHPVTGEQLSPEKAFEYAAKERMKLGTETPEQGMKSIRTFGQNQAYQTSYKQLLTDYPKFVSEYDPTKLSEFHQGQIALQKGHIEEQIRSNTDNATERLLKSFQAKAKASPSELGPADLESAKIPVSVGFGVTKTILSPDMEVTYQNTISGKKNADKMSPELINAYSELNRIKGQTVRDVTAKQVDDILKRINKGKNSPATNIQIMDDVAAIFTIGKDYDKNLFDAYQIKPFQQEASQEISDTFKKAITYGNNKASSVR
jgi:hypothetical protein